MKPFDWFLIAFAGWGTLRFVSPFFQRATAVAMQLNPTAVAKELRKRFCYGVALPIAVLLFRLWG